MKKDDEEEKQLIRSAKLINLENEKIEVLNKILSIINQSEEYKIQIYSIARDEIVYIKFLLAHKSSDLSNISDNSTVLGGE